MLNLIKYRIRYVNDCYKKFLGIKNLPNPSELVITKIKGNFYGCCTYDSVITKVEGVDSWLQKNKN